MDGPSPCCTPSTAPREQATPAPVFERGARSTRGQRLLRGSDFTMGDGFGEGYVADGEAPAHRVRVQDFYLDETSVTNAQFATFTKATGYVTEAEDLGLSAVFHLAVQAERRDIVSQAEQTPWWIGVNGADWRHPNGPLSTIADRPQHPVVQVTWHDANAYAAWAGKRLPTEAEWEYAARGGLEGARFPWGDDLMDRGRWRLNIFQGRFPEENTVEDGWATTAPVKSYRPNGHGLHQMAGNVWEWCADRFSPTTYAERVAAGTPGEPILDPLAPGSGAEGGEIPRVMRGGSYLCHDSYCHRYRVAARSANTAESAAGNLGFRCANDA